MVSYSLGRGPRRNKRRKRRILAINVIPDGTRGGGEAGDDEFVNRPKECAGEDGLVGGYD